MASDYPGDSCSRCGLRRYTRELEQHGVIIRLCDECYWGQTGPDDDTQADPQMPRRRA